MARLLTEQEFEQRFVPEDTFVQPEPRDIVQTLEGAGFVPAPQTNVLDLVGTTPAPAAPAFTAAGQPSTDPRDLITYLNKTDPNFAQTALDKYRSDYAAASAELHGATPTTQLPGTNVSGWNITPFETYRPDPSGMDIPDRQVTDADKILGGYNATKTTFGESGKPIENTLTYDANGAITGSTQRVFTGGDSGYVIYRDAAGNITGGNEFDYSEAWKSTAIPLAQMALMAATAGGASGFFTPGAETALGQALGTAGSKALGAGALGAIGGGTMAGLQGQDILKGALVGGATGALSTGAGELLGKKAGELAGAAFQSSPEVASIARDVASGAVTGAARALPGAVATGDYGSVGIGALTGAGGKVIGNALGDTAEKMGINLTQKQLDTGINLVRAVQSGNTTAMVNYAAQLTGSRDANVAAKAYTTLKAFQSGNPFAAAAAFMQLGQAVGGGTTTARTSGGTQVAGAGPGDFETRSIIEPGDMGGTLVPGEAGEDVDPNRVVVAGRNDPTDFLSLFDIDTASTGLSTDRANQRVEVEAPRSREDIALDYFFYPNDEGVAGGPAGQKVDVLGNRIADQAVDVIDLFDRDTATQKVTETAPTDITNQKVVLPGKKVEPWSGEPFDLVGMPADVASQKVGVTSTKLPPEVTTPATAPAPASRPTLSVNLPTKQNLAMPTARQQDMSYITDLPLYRSVFYERQQQAERQKELARALQEQENADPYERLMALAEQNPNMAVDELMKIVEGP
jgi:hypothetical protein